MIKQKKNLLLSVSFSATLALLSACGGDSGGGAGVAGVAGVAAESGSFAFPQFSDDSGSVSVNIPEGPTPEFSARRKVSNGGGSAVGFGDPVVLRYSMFAWSTGEMIESSDDFDEPVTLRAGIAEGAPEYLSKSLLGRNIGDKLEIVFEQGMDDLPSYLSKDDAYVLLVELM